MDTVDTLLVRRFDIQAIHNAQRERVLDVVAAEEPLEIRIQYWFKGAQHAQSLAVTMRTPGHDRELAAGLLLAEGVITRRHDVIDIRSLGSEPSNEVLVELASDVDFETWRIARQIFVSSSCGVCGKRSREAISVQSAEPVAANFRISTALIQSLPALLRERQRGFCQTGGLHAAAVVDLQGNVHGVFEDIGRHNALDKLIGAALLDGRVPLSDFLLFLSSRSSFELIQKAVMAGAPVLATIGGPSSLAIETARQYGLTLIGFVRGDRFNVYSGEWRIDSE